MEKKKIILAGAVPPPYHGTNISNARILNSKIGEIFCLYHLDTSDHRDLKNLGRIDIKNVLLSIKNFYSLFWMVNRKKPDLVYLVIAQNLAYLRDGIFILISRCFSRAKIIIHLRSSYFKKFYDRSNWFIKKFIDFTLSKVDSSIVLGSSLKPILNKWVRDIKVVPNGTDFNPDISKKSYKGKKELTVSFLGNLYEFKGIFDLMEAAKIIAKNNTNIKFIFGGPWPEDRPGIKERAFEYVKSNGLEDQVEFKGLILREDRERFYLDTDIFVLPSWSEGHPNVVLEAMAAACPVISTRDVGAISDTVIDGKTGILVNKKSPPQIADAINYLAENPADMEKMGRAGRLRFEKEYTLDKNIESLIDVFNKTICSNKY
jgi:glycosyltransferase involved in cell wall biosynthesis